MTQLPSDTICGECGAVVDLDPGKWYGKEERGYFQALNCAECGAGGCVGVGAPEFLEQLVTVFDKHMDARAAGATSVAFVDEHDKPARRLS